MKKQKIILLTLLTVVMFLIVVSCRNEIKVYKIGIITPLTGEGATYGQATKRGVELAVNEINADDGIQNHEIELVFEDSKINPSIGITVINKLITVDKVPIILGAFGSSVCQAIAPIANNNETVLFSASATADTLKYAGEYFFRNVPSNSRQGATAAKFVLDKLEYKSAAIVYKNNEYGVSLTNSFENFFLKNGGNLLIKESYDIDTKDFRSQLTKIKSKSPQVIFIPGHYQDSAQLLKQAKELGIKSIFIGGDGSYSPELIKIAGNAVEGAYFTLMQLGYGVTDSLLDHFKTSYFEKYNEEFNVYSAYAFDAIKIISQAIASGGYDAKGIKSALYEINDFKGVTGVTSFDRWGEVDKSFDVYVVKEGKFKIVNWRK